MTPLIMDERTSIDNGNFGFSSPFSTVQATTAERRGKIQANRNQNEDARPLGEIANCASARRRSQRRQLRKQRIEPMDLLCEGGLLAMFSAGNREMTRPWRRLDSTPRKHASTEVSE